MGIKVFRNKPEISLEIKKKFGLYLYKKKDFKNAKFYLLNYTDERKMILNCFKKTLDIENLLIYAKENDKKDYK